MAKIKNLQPWLDYFDMLSTYEDKRLLEVNPEKHEAYVTRPSLFTLSGVTITDENVDMPSVMVSVARTLRHLRTYAAWKSQHGDNYLSRPFALHVVKEGETPDLLCTLLMYRRRVWWKLWFRADRIELIEY